MEQFPCNLSNAIAEKNTASLLNRNIYCKTYSYICCNCFGIIAPLAPLAPPLPPNRGGKCVTEACSTATLPVSNLASGNTDFRLGVEYYFGKHTKVGATTQTGLISREVQSLKSLRRAALPSHWRNSVDISAGIIQINAP